MLLRAFVRKSSGIDGYVFGPWRWSGRGRAGALRRMRSAVSTPTAGCVAIMAIPGHVAGRPEQFVVYSLDRERHGIQAGRTGRSKTQHIYLYTFTTNISCLPVVILHREENCLGRILGDNESIIIPNITFVLYYENCFSFFSFSRYKIIVWFLHSRR